VQLTVPASSGALTRLVNAGTLQSNGVELALNITMVQQKKFYWIARMNVASGNTRVVRLDGSVKEIVYYQGEQNALKIVAESGKKVGNIYVYPRLKDGSGNDVIGNDGLYVMDNTRYELAGNVMPKITGGLANTFSWKNLSLNFMIDYRLGGQLVSPALKYNIGAGMYESTLQYRDASHGGLAYYINSGGEKILVSAGGAPAGAKIYNDGIVLKGANLNGKENTSIVDAATYYMNMFGWGAAALNKEGTVYNNSYAKMREAVLAFNLSEQLAKKIHCKVLRVSLIGRNLFYLFRTLKNLDPEAPIGSSWSRQSIDEGSSAATRSYGIALNFGL
jgi:iron complex outermembrane recepter protein